MGETGLLTEDSRVELIEGEIVEMAPIASEHGGMVKRLNDLFSSKLHGKAIVSIQDPVVLGDDSEPQPDIAILHWRDDFYATAHPGAQDLLLLVEVSDTTVCYDHEVKCPLYARHGVPEAWLLNLPERHLEIYREPVNGKYRQVAQHRAGQVAPERLPEAAIELTDLFPKP